MCKRCNFLTYISHETCDSLIHSLDNNFLTKSNERIKKCDDIVIYADESTSAARKEMLVFLGFFLQYLMKWINNLK